MGFPTWLLLRTTSSGSWIRRVSKSRKKDESKDTAHEVNTNGECYRHYSQIGFVFSVMPTSWGIYHLKIIGSKMLCMLCAYAFQLPCFLTTAFKAKEHFLAALNTRFPLLSFVSSLFSSAVDENNTELKMAWNGNSFPGTLEQVFSILVAIQSHCVWNKQTHLPPHLLIDILRFWFNGRGVSGARRPIGFQTRFRIFYRTSGAVVFEELCCEGGRKSYRCDWQFVAVDQFWL